MDAAQFLARVIAPGNFAAIAHKKPHQTNMTQRFYPRDQLGGMAGYAQWCARNGMDAWHAVASYVMAEPDGVDGRGATKMSGARTQANVQALKCFWVDIDVKRDGDKKQPDRVYADMPAAIGFLRTFLAATKIPKPNLWVNSGYGLHVYWVLEDAVAPQDWQPYADALKAALLASNATLDVGLSSDSARLLRPPETLNFKDPANPKPVEVLSKLSLGDYPNAMMFQALQPYVGLIAPKAVHYGSGGGGVLTGGGPASVFAGRSVSTSAHQTASTTSVPASTSTSTSAAQANMPGRRQHLFSEIVTRCQQAKQSLDAGGLGDPYPLWYLGWLSLLHFCDDGASYVHPISQGDPRYDPVKTDDDFLQISAEHFRKHTGAPTCTHIENRGRPGGCQGCPHWGRIVSPYSLGVPGVPDDDLPDGYARLKGAIVRRTTDEDGNPKTEVVIGGDVYGPILDKIGDDRKLTFTYDRAGDTSIVAVMQSAVPVDAKVGMSLFGPQGVTLYRHNATTFGSFIVAWIEKLRDMHAERVDNTPQFGWLTKSDGSYGGLAVGGTLYKSDGSTELVAGGDPKIIGMFHPRGTLAGWKTAADFVLKNRPDLQVLVGAAFGSPLLEFTGHSGVVLSAWSRDSAVGKTSALLVGTTVWSDARAMLSFDDTPNSVHYRIGQTRFMPAYWDEIDVKRDDTAKIVDTLFKLGQGRDKARLNADSTLKASGDWKTMLVTTGNRPLMDFIEKERSDTDAGALRLFEFLFEHPQLPLDAKAAQTIAGAAKHAGNAGRIYAAWLAQNPKAAETLVMSQQKKLHDALNATQGERFYIAAMACILIGAGIAHALQLITVDSAAMQTFLKDAFEKLRTRRAKNLPVNAGYFDIERVLADFVSHHAANRLVTRHFGRPGRTPASNNQDIVWAPRQLSGRLAVHIGQQPQCMRIDKAVLTDWAHAHGFSPSDLVHQFEVRWKARVLRGVMGSGTDFASGKIYYIEIPLTTPELAPYNYDNTVSPTQGVT